MAQWRSFNASNAPGTCLWCGRKLYRKTVKSHYEATEVPLTEKEIASGAYLEGQTTRKVYKTVVDKRAEKAGDYQDDQFCGLRCGMQFAWRMADAGCRVPVVRRT
jgi:hypothetical protein